MNSEMKTAYGKYFERLNSLYADMLNSKPTVPYSDSFDKTMLLGSPDEEGEIQWLPLEQKNEYDWSHIETKLGFAICQELKDYYNTYFFLALTGTFGSCQLVFYRIDGVDSIDKIILRNYKDAQYVFPGSECFLIGNAVVNDDDSYFIYYDNATGKLFCYESDTGKELLLSYSLAKTIGNMEASL